MMTRSICIFLLWAILLPNSVLAADIKVKYLSSEHIYLDGGSSAGLEVGAILVIKNKNKITAKLEVIHISTHSASCKILSSDSEINAGDKVEILSIPSNMAITPAIIAADTIKDSQTVSAITATKKSTARVRGYLGLQWYSFNDNSANHYNFSQPAIRFKLTGTGLANNNLGFEIKLRARHYRRSGRQPEDEWRNRIYTFRISYQNPASPVQISLGRIISNNISGTGYIDGLQFNHELSTNWYWGFMAGFKPEWQYSHFQTGEKKYGLYFGYKNDISSAVRVDASMAAAGEYHESTVSREFIYLRSSFSQGNSWNIYHSMEIDINRDWRKERTGKTVTLSSLYISGQAKLNNQISTRISYDNRRNYYRYEYMSLADSLFDDAFRQGLRLFFYYRPQKNIRLSLNGGLRKKENDDQTTYSYGASIRVGKLFIPTLAFTGRGGVFSNIYTTGINYSFMLNNRWYPGFSTGINYGAHFYKLTLNSLQYQNQWVRLNISLDIFSSLSLSGFYEYDFGDDQKGHHIFTELGYRF